MNHHHKKTMQALFAHPVSANIKMKDVESLLRDLGADISTSHAGKVHVTLNGRTVNFAMPKHSLPKEEVQQVKHFITACGIDPETAYPG
ncbi:hypothetical protein [Aestuariispira insulae]|uniref:HicA-like toxin of HicAB toxin-antitoxin system n=1 Tax=Aestuariispira insulae TaxID=1461337 RepID=A0A3D9HRJ0_9PROT|nr:hypothetical protein [Aestuariispira insulae]RED52090.1 hypothetical protein DFP90_102108 [Aestuariispira insulae]